MAKLSEDCDGVRQTPRESTAKPAAPERVAAFRTGLSAESRAAAFLMAKGYRILARRFRTPHGEIDLIARRRNLRRLCRGQGPRHASTTPPLR